MIRLDKTLHAWGTSDFEVVFKQEILQLGVDHLPLQQGLSGSNYVADTPVTVMINRAVEMEKVIRVTAGIFYQGVVGGCSCADNPAPAGAVDEYCEMQFDIDKTTAVTTVVPVTE